MAYKCTLCKYWWNGQDIKGCAGIQGSNTETHRKVYLLLDVNQISSGFGVYQNSRKKFTRNLGNESKFNP